MYNICSSTEKVLLTLQKILNIKRGTHPSNELYFDL